MSARARSRIIAGSDDRPTTSITAARTAAEGVPAFRRRLLSFLSVPHRQCHHFARPGARVRPGSGRSRPADQLVFPHLRLVPAAAGNFARSLRPAPRECRAVDAGRGRRRFVRTRPEPPRADRRARADRSRRLRLPHGEHQGIHPVVSAESPGHAQRLAAFLRRPAGPPYPRNRDAPSYFAPALAASSWAIISWRAFFSTSAAAP